jgi:esterase FrsA
MADIVGNAVGFDHRPTPTELGERMAALSLRPLLDQDGNAPMLAVDGADDVHVPQHDTLVFTGRQDTEVELVPDSGHCAVSRLGDVLPKMIGWVNRALNA